MTIFVDDEGRRCAMAELMWQDGERSMVRRTGRISNGVKLGNVTDGPLMDWIEASGLTQDEVAFVQVPDFQIAEHLPLPIQEQLITQEQQRIQDHLMAAANQLELYGDAAIETAIAQLDAHTLSSPPAESVADSTLLSELGLFL